jgi:hypothetical protein
MVRHDERCSAVNRWPVIAASMQGESAIRSFGTILNSLFGSSFNCPRSAKPLIGWRFQRRRLGGAIKFPVIFPVSREFVCLRIRGMNVKHYFNLSEVRYTQCGLGRRIGQDKISPRVVAPRERRTSKVPLFDIVNDCNRPAALVVCTECRRRISCPQMTASPVFCAPSASMRPARGRRIRPDPLDALAESLSSITKSGGGFPQ